MARKLATTGLCLFLISIFLPFFDFLGPRLGYEYLIECITWIGDDLSMLWHEVLFILTYLMMIILPLLLLTRYRRIIVPIYLILFQIVLIAHPLFFLITLPFGVLRSGFYLLVVSMALVLWAAILTRNSDPYSMPNQRNGKYGHLLTKP